jgi:hypothetical protein
MVLIMWLKLILYVACLALILIWLLTGRKNKALLAFAGGCGLIASLLSIISP